MNYEEHSILSLQLDHVVSDFQPLNSVKYEFC